MENKSVLILMSTYNGEKYLEEQLESIFNQKTKCTVDLLIRDDGSTDKTGDILREYHKKYHDRITVIMGENLGYNQSYFKLLQLANEKKYDYYAFSDQDDVWLDDKVQAAVDKLDKFPDDEPNLYGGCSYLTDEKLNTIGVTTRTDKPLSIFNLIIQNFLPGHSQVFNTKMLNLMLERTTKISSIYVYDSWIACSALVTGNVYFDVVPHTLYRQHGTNGLGHASEKRRLSWIKEKMIRIRKNDSHKYAKQIEDFYRTYNQCMTPEENSEISKFLHNRNSVWSRITYIFTSKLYRLNMWQTVMFKLLYICGGYS